MSFSVLVSTEDVASSRIIIGEFLSIALAMVISCFCPEDTFALSERIVSTPFGIAKIEADEFLEYEEVYPGRFYGTLKSQVEVQSAQGQTVIFDVDVKGGVNIKKFYGDRALAVFIQPPSIEELRRRLEKRGTDAPEVIDSRVQRAEFELGFAPFYDVVIVNDDLQKAQAEALAVVQNFLSDEKTEA